MNQIPEPLGTLYIAKEVYHFDKWITDQAIAAADIVMKKYKRFDGYLKPSPVREGDFSLLLAIHKIDPVIATFIGIPGIQKAPIIQELFVKS